MAYYLNEDWLQEVVASIELPSISSSVAREALPVIEMQIKKLIQQSHKFQRRGKKRYLTVDDFNMALTMNRLEPLYGLLPQSQSVASMTLSSAPPTKKIKLVDLVKQPLPHYPLQPQLSLHWLAVEGVQPTIPENPNVSAPSLLSPYKSIATIPRQKEASTELGDDATVLSSSVGSLSLVSLPKEMQLVYIRIIRALEGVAHSENTLFAVYDALVTDPGMQVLVPHICLFIYTKVREQPKSLDLLQRLMRAVKSLVLNQHINLEYHLQQLLPAIFTCVVGSQQISSRDVIYYYTSEKTTTSVNPLLKKDSNIWAMNSSSCADDDGWDLRVAGSEIISMCCAKYSTIFPDLQARVIRTYMEGLGTSSTGEVISKSLNTLYGAIAGLSTLGNVIVGQVLLPRVSHVMNRLETIECSLKTELITIRSATSKDSKDKNLTELKRKDIRQQLNTLAQLRLLLLNSLGRYMIDALKTSGPKFSMDGKTTKSEETIALTALSCGLAESSSVYIAATNSDCSYCCRLFL